MGEIEFLNLLGRGLNILGAYEAITKYGPKIEKELIGLNKRSFYDIDEIFPEIIKGNINFGDTIECGGFLSKYSQTFKPMSFVPSLAGKANEKIKSKKIVDGKLMGKAQLEVSWQRLQAPIKILPSINNLQLCFLYRENFDTFIYPVEKENGEEEIIVPEKGRPIPVLININENSHAIDKFVEMKAKIISIPSEWIKMLQGIYDDLLIKHNCNYFNPYSEKSSFICLTLLNENTNLNVIKDSPSDVMAQVFAEIHVEGLENYEDEQKKIVFNSIPERASKGINVITIEGYNAFPFITKGSIRVVFKKPNIIGLYTEINLFNNKNYFETISDLHHYSRKLSRNIQNISEEVIGKRLKTKTDFVFDPTKAHLFDSRGILNINGNFYRDFDYDTHKNTINWYKNDK